MSDLTSTLGSRRELAHRQSGKADVYLLWSSETDTLAVTVVDPDGSFELVVGPTEAFDVFQHPYAYAAQRGVRPLEPVA
jgi:hypothetical protein